VNGLRRENSLGFYGGKANRAILAGLERQLKPFGMSPVQYLALGQIFAGDATSPSDLADTLSITRATAVRLIDRLERDGLVTREPDPNDGRVKILRPTEKAEALWGQVSDIGPRNLEKAYQGMDPADIEKAKRILMQVCANLQS
jgi:MarR family transcriptional regulator for hemolysin